MVKKEEEEEESGGRTRKSEIRALLFQPPLSFSFSVAFPLFFTRPLFLTFFFTRHSLDGALFQRRREREKNRREKRKKSKTGPHLFFFFFPRQLKTQTTKKTRASRCPPRPPPHTHKPPCTLTENERELENLSQPENREGVYSNKERR